jgi:hypothetical protein
MLKKMMLLAMAVGALVAFAAPAVSQAATLSDSTGNVPAGAWLHATSTNTKTTINAQLTLVCAHVELSGEAIGEGEEIAAVAGGGVATNCEVSPLGAPATITSISFELGIEEEEATFAFGYDALGASGCTDETVEPVKAEWTIGTDIIHVHGGPLLGTGAGCPAGAAEIHGTFTVTTTGGDPVYRTS